MSVYQLNEFAAFSIGKCKKCQKINKLLRTYKNNQMCNPCWIPIWLKALTNPSNQSTDQQELIKNNLKICGYKEKGN